MPKRRGAEGPALALLLDRYALAALKGRRATISAEIAQLEGKLRHRRQLLVHVDSC